MLRACCDIVDEPARIIAFATQGAGGDDETRLRALLENFSVEFFPFDRRAKRRSFFGVLEAIRRQRPDVVVMEGTGLAGGFALVLGRLLAGVPYVVSSGDAVGPFVGAQRPSLGLIFGLYERLLCRWSAGFIGWTPYLTGRSLTFGAPRAVTAAGWAPVPRTSGDLAAGRARVRRELGIPADAIVFGLVGSLAWNERVRYCYGCELVQALLRVNRPDVRVLIVGDGDGTVRLERLAGERLGKSVLLTGRVPRDQVPYYLAAMDVASLPQSVDNVGSFRYTTKLSEYLDVGLPVITGQIPLAYDLDVGWLWRIPGTAPWDERYISAVTELMIRLTLSELTGKRSAVPHQLPEFDRTRQIALVTAFLTDLLTERVVRAQCR